MDDLKQVEVIIKFYLPDNEEELEMAMKGKKYFRLLLEVYNECRTILKYEIDSNPEKLKLAKRIREMVGEVIYEE